MALKVKGAGSALDNLSLPGKLAVGLVAVLMIAAAYFVIFYGDVESDIGAQQNLIDQKRKEAEQAEAAKVAYMKDIEEKSRREALAQKQKKILPDEAESPAFLSALQTVATISGVLLSSWTPEDEEPADFYAKVPMRLELQGRFHQIAKFFQGVGQVDRIINVENITIKAVKKDSGGDKTKEPSKDKKAAVPPPNAVEQPVDVKVECLATAFRTLRPDEKGQTDEKSTKGRPRKPRGGKK